MGPIDLTYQCVDRLKELGSFIGLYRDGCCCDNHDQLQRGTRILVQA